MTSRLRLRGAAYIGIAIALTRGTAHALVRFNDGTDKIFVSGSFAIGHSSNLSASAAGTGDYSYQASAALQYQRHAGLITVDANVAFNLTNYFSRQNHSYDALNPTYSVEFDKGTGRTTGALTLNATRSSQADAAANVHDTSWNLGAGLNLKYPIIERWSMTGALNASYLDFTQSNNASLQNLLTWGAQLGTFYILNDERDLFATYRYRFQQSSQSTSSTDQALSAGVNGKVWGRINGSLSLGGQVRQMHGVPEGLAASEGPYYAWTGTGALSCHYTKKLTITGQLNKDFNTTSTDASTDNTTASVGAQYAYNAKLSAHGEVAGGETRFLGPFGLLPNSSTERRDYNYNWSAGLSWTHNEHLHVDFTYNYVRNWSNLSFAQFVSTNWSLSFGTHW